MNSKLKSIKPKKGINNSDEVVYSPMMNQEEESLYDLIQDLKGPIYLSRFKNKFTVVCKVQKLQSKISRTIFDKGQKSQAKVPKEVPDIKFWNQRFYYYSKFDEGIQMDYESK